MRGWDDTSVEGVERRIGVEAGIRGGETRSLVRELPGDLEDTGVEVAELFEERRAHVCTGYLHVSAEGKVKRDNINAYRWSQNCRRGTRP